MDKVVNTFIRHKIQTQNNNKMKKKRNDTIKIQTLHVYHKTSAVYSHKHMLYLNT